jgi:dTDP-4-dehydrorhamnose 3,5-epimerase
MTDSDNRLKFQATSINGLFEIKRNLYQDDRGWFSRLFCENEFESFGWPSSIRQINHAYTKDSGTVRGMHYQYSPGNEAKLVTCIKGVVWDVAIDMRKGSETFLHWHACELSENDNNSLFIPSGFAHGYQTLSENVELIYLHSEAFNSSLESGINAMDPKIGIDWPLKIKKRSIRDQNLPLITSDFQGL